jgi:deoxyadenosine/deoxycytidine kinase
MNKVVNISGLIGAGKTSLARELSIFLRSNEIQLIKLEETVNQLSIESMLNTMYSTWDKDIIISVQKYFIEDSATKISQIKSILGTKSNVVIVLDTSLLIAQAVITDSLYELNYLSEYQYSELSQSIMEKIVVPFLELECNTINVHVIRSIEFCIESLKRRNTSERVIFTNKRYMNEFQLYLETLNTKYNMFISENKDDYFFIEFENNESPSDVFNIKNKSFNALINSVIFK